MSKIVDRFLKYVSFDTTSDENQTCYPTTAKQLLLLDYLKNELESIGVSGVSMDEHGYVYGSIPATPGHEKDTPVGFLAHVDVSQAVSGANIRPRIVKFEGQDIQLNDRVWIRYKEFPEMSAVLGDDLIVTDGTTLLGADDKAGVAEIMCAAEYLVNHPEFPHGRICVAFNPDEEVGRGTEFFDQKTYGAEYAYTIDGGLLGELEYECFNAAAFSLKINGVNIHPGMAKNKMKNSVLIAGEFINMLPPFETPGHTENYEGFYHVEEVSGNEESTTVCGIIRDHNRDLFSRRKEFVKRIVDFLNDKYGEGTVELTMSDTYYNMRELLEDKLYIIDRAKKAMLDAGVTPDIKPIRGGTDGSALTFMGLPCPNLSTGGSNFHGVLEYVSIQSMEKMVEIILNIAKAQ